MKKYDLVIGMPDNTIKNKEINADGFVTSNGFLWFYIVSGKNSRETIFGSAINNVITVTFKGESLE